MGTLDYWEIKEELVVFLRNADIFTITQRSVTTATATGTWAAFTGSYKIAVANVKNIRSVTVGGAAISFGTDYTVNYNKLDTTIKCDVTIVTAQTGTFIITYDYGTDKIFPDFPKTSLSISSFPRIALDLIGVQTELGGFGNVMESRIEFTAVVYDTDIEDINGYITAIRSAFIGAWTDFYYLKSVIHPTSTGPVLKSPQEMGKDKIFQQNIDFRSIFNYEKN